MIIIRKAKEKDVDKIMDLLVQVDMVHHNGRPDIFKGPTTKYTRDELINMINEDSKQDSKNGTSYGESKKTIFVITDSDETVLGHAFCIDKSVKDDNLLKDIKTLYIDDICIDENMRNQSLGEFLYKYIIDYAKQHSYYNVTLNVWSCNEGAMKFYEKLGMKPQKVGMEKILDYPF